jgi:hypothetical protein
MSFKYKPLPASPCQWAWGTGTPRIRQALGFQSSKMPANFHGRFKVDGWTIVVKRGVKAAVPKERYRKKTAKHRIFIDHGGKLIPAGRIYQALCRRQLLKSRRRATKQRRGPRGQFVDRWTK